jgi:heat shock protein HtpX
MRSYTGATEDAASGRAARLDGISIVAPSSPYLAIFLNLAKVWGLLLAFCAALGALGWVLGEYRLASIFVFCALLAAVTTWWHGERVALGMVGARKAAESEAPTVRASLDRLARRAGIVAPKLYLINDPFPRSLAAGRGATGSAVALSTGLVATASPAELEGILAHEVAHVARRDVVVQTVAVLVAATLVELTRIGGFLQRALLFVLAPVASAFVHLLLSSRRELQADRVAARLCESPHGLADALLRLDLAGELVGLDADPVTEPLYTVNPFPRERPAALFDTHPPVAERVRRLRELDPAWPEKLRGAA